MRKKNLDAIPNSIYVVPHQPFNHAYAARALPPIQECCLAHAKRANVPV